MTDVMNLVPVGKTKGRTKNFLKDTATEFKMLDRFRIFVSAPVFGKHLFLVSTSSPSAAASVEFKLSWEWGY